MRVLLLIGLLGVAVICLFETRGQASADEVIGSSEKGWWFPARDDASKALLYKDQKLIGAWCHKTRSYRPWTAAGFGPSCEPPTAPPSPPLEVLKKAHNEGLQVEKLNWEGFSDGGIPVSREQALAALETDIPDDHNRPRITIQGTRAAKDNAMRQVRDWLIKRAIADKVVLWSGLVDDPILKRRGFEAEGDPTVWIQDPTGRQLFKVANFKGDFSIAAMEDALARWDPRLFPSLRPSGLFGVPGLTVEFLCIIFLFVFVLFLWWKTTRR